MDTQPDEPSPSASPAPSSGAPESCMHLRHRSLWHHHVAAAAASSALQHQQRHASGWAFWRRPQPEAGGSSGQHASLGVEATDSFPTSPPDPSPPPVMEAPEDPTASPFPPESVDAAAAIGQACDAIEQASIAAAQADMYLTTSLFLDAFQFAHNSGLPWWGALAAVNVTTRILMSPAIILQQKASAKMMAFNIAMTKAKQIQQALAKAKTFEEQRDLSNALRQEYDSAIAKHGHPLQIVWVVPLVLIANATIFISIFSATSQLMESKAPSLVTGGMLWFHNLTIPDAYYGLPVLCCLVTLAMVEYGISLNGEQSPTMQKQAETFKWIMRVLSLAFIPTGAWVPAGVAVLWVSNSAVGVGQGFLLRNDAFRAAVGLPSMQQMRDLGVALELANRPNEEATTGQPGGVATWQQAMRSEPPPPGTPPQQF